MSLSKSIRCAVCVATLLVGGTMAQESGAKPVSSVRGMVRWQGEIPPVRTVDASCDSAIAKQWPKGLIEIPAPAVQQDGGVGGALVWISEGLPDRTWPTPTTPLRLVLARGIFDRPFAVLRVGQPWEVRIEDATTYSLHLTSIKNGDWNRTFPEGAAAGTFDAFTKEEVTTPAIKCDCHPWVRMNLAILEHPFFTTTDHRGRFDLRGLDSGTYEVMAWHPALGRARAKIAVSVPEHTEVDLQLVRRSK